MEVTVLVVEATDVNIRYAYTQDIDSILYYGPPSTQWSYLAYIVECMMREMEKFHLPVMSLEWTVHKV